MRRVISLAAIACVLAFVGAYLMAKATATPYCTWEVPYPPSYDQVCTGPYQSCVIGLACSPVPGTPGTQNPNGYTPSCDNIYGCV